VKILFLARRNTYFRNVDSVIRELASRGHSLLLAVDRDGAEGRPLVDALVAEFPGRITFKEIPPRSGDDWTWMAERLRHGLDHLRYQHRMFADTPKLVERSRERTPGVFVSLGRFIRRVAPWARRPVTAVVDWLERSTPESPSARAFIEAYQPDLVLITPLIGLGSSQIDYLRVARAMGLPTGLAVWSWDHLSSKALIRDLPDRVFVWNETQKSEAMTLHHVPAERIVVTGAQCFDRWFGRSPSRDRETFCRNLGLPSGPPILLYVCSAPFIGSQPEAPFVADWVARVRGSSSPRLREASILIRPHPSRRQEWEHVDLSAHPGVVVWGSSPVDESARNDYFDSLWHSTAVVGLNTSAFIEAAIVGRPVFTILLPEWHESQLGTTHFKYLFEAGGGLLIASRAFDEHLAQLDEAVGHPSAGVRPFVRSFVRPHGLDVAATPIFVREVEAMRSLKVAPPEPPLLQGLARRLLEAAMPLRHAAGKEHLVYAECEIDTVRRFRAVRAAKAERDRAVKQQLRAERAAREAAVQAQLSAHRAGKRARGKTADPPGRIQ
jgi:hypothetical protein